MRLESGSIVRGTQGNVPGLLNLPFAVLDLALAAHLLRLLFLVLPDGMCFDGPGSHKEGNWLSENRQTNSQPHMKKDVNMC